MNIIQYLDEGRADAAYQLVQRFTDPDICNYVDPVTGETPLIAACRAGDERIAGALLAKCRTAINVGHAANNGYTALIYACKNTMSAIAEAIFATGRSNSRQVAGDGMTARAYAVQNSMHSIVFDLPATGATESPEPFHRSSPQYNPASPLVMQNPFGRQRTPSPPTTTARGPFSRQRPPHVFTPGSPLFGSPARSPALTPPPASTHTHPPAYIDVGALGTDFITQREVSVKAYIEESPQNLVFELPGTGDAKHYFLTTKDAIKHNYASCIKYECLADNNDLAYDNIVTDMPLFHMRQIGVMVDFVYASEIDQILTAFAKQMYKLVMIRTVVSSISRQVLSGVENPMSASHCQAGQGGAIYRLVPLTPSCVRDVVAATAVAATAVASPQARVVFINVQDKKHEFAITPSTTVGELREELAARIAVEPARIRLVLAGKIAKLDDLVMQLPGFAPGVTFSVSVRQTAGGGRRRTQRARRQKRKTHRRRRQS